MNKHDVEKWCIEHGYALMDIKKKDHVPVEYIFKIAMESTGVESIRKDKQTPQHSFARFLAISYLDSYYACGVLADMVAINHTTVSYARSMDLLQSDVKCFKPWQQSAILYFREKLNEAKERLNEDS